MESGTSKIPRRVCAAGQKYGPSELIRAPAPHRAGRRDSISATEESAQVDV